MVLKKEKISGLSLIEANRNKKSFHRSVDTSFTATGKELDVLSHQINCEPPLIYEWLCFIKLSLNVSKTKYLVFQPHQKNNYNLYPPMKLADHYLQHCKMLDYRL